MSQAGFFDFAERLEQLNQAGNPLAKLDELVDFEQFRPTLMEVRQKPRKSNAGARPFDVVLMFKMLVLRSLYNLSLEQIEFQVRDRVSFMGFLGLEPGDRVPDEKTVWRFEDELAQLGLMETLFDAFNADLSRRGYAAHQGSMIDASIVQTPRQRNTRDQNDQIKQGQRPRTFDDNPAVGRQKDTHARWTKKRGTSYFGYKNHVNVDAGHKLIRKYTVTDASVHDSRQLESLLDPDNQNRDVYADAAYRSRAIEDHLAEHGYRSRIHRKGTKQRPLNDRQKAANRRRSAVRARVEHVFGIQFQRLGKATLRGIGIVRSGMRIGLRNLTYNMSRYVTLHRRRSSPTPA